jgi:hypothetical protein
MNIQHRKDWDERQWAQCLVDHVSMRTQLEPGNSELPHHEDWRACAEILFRQLIQFYEKP